MSPAPTCEKCKVKMKFSHSEIWRQGSKRKVFAIYRCPKCDAEVKHRSV